MRDLKLHVSGKVAWVLRYLSAVLDISIDSVLAYLLAGILKKDIRERLRIVLGTLPDMPPEAFRSYRVGENYLYVRRLARLWRVPASVVVSRLVDAIENEVVREQIESDVRLVLKVEEYADQLS